MSEDRKKVSDNQASEEQEMQEIDLDDLEQVTGGSLHNVQYTKTVDISEDTKKKI